MIQVKSRIVSLEKNEANIKQATGRGTQMMKELNKLAVIQKADKLHLGATKDGASIYKSVGYDEPRFVSLEIKFSLQGSTDMQR